MCSQYVPTETSSRSLCLFLSLFLYPSFHLTAFLPTVHFQFKCLVRFSDGGRKFSSLLDDLNFAVRRKRSFVKNCKEEEERERGRNRNLLQENKLFILIQLNNDSREGGEEKTNNGGRSNWFCRQHAFTCCVLIRGLCISFFFTLRNRIGSLLDGRFKSIKRWLKIGGLIIG